MNLKFTEIDFLKQLEKFSNLNKRAQQAPIETNSPYNKELISSIAKKLVAKLSQKTGDNDAPYMENIKDFPSLLNYLGDQKSPHDGKQIVYHYHSPNNPSMGFPKGGFIDGSPDQKDIKLYAPWPAQDPAFYVYKDGLVSWLQNKQADAEAQPNELLSAILGRRIEDAKKELNIDIKPLSSKEDVIEFQDNAVLDKINSLIDPKDFKNPEKKAGTIEITPNILKNRGSFDDLIQQLQLSQDGETIPSNKFGKDEYCSILNYLRQRADFYYFRRQESVDKYYIKLISDLQKDYGCESPNGNEDNKSNKNIALTNVSWSPGQPLPGAAVQAVQSIQYPLVQGSIDFDRIARWTQGYKNLIASLNKISTEKVQEDPNADSVIDRAKKFRSGFGVITQPLNSSPENIYEAMFQQGIKKTNDPKKAIHWPAQYLGEVNSLLIELQNVLSSFKNFIYSSMPDDLRKELDRQIGESDSLISVDLLQVRQWLSSIDDAGAKYNKRIGGLNG